MNGQLKGIALLLAGCILALVGVASQIYATGSANMVWSLFALIFGASGLVMTFMKDNKR